MGYFVRKKRDIHYHNYAFINQVRSVGTGQVAKKATQTQKIYSMQRKLSFCPTFKQLFMIFPKG